MNFTYKTNPCSENVPVPAVMTHGKFSYFDKASGNGFDLYVDRVIEGSLAPGTRQAIVVVVCDFPTDGGTSAAYLYDERKKGAVFIERVATANWGIDWGGRPYSIHVRFAGKFLYVDACENDACGAYVVTTYAVRHGKIVPVYRQRHHRAE